MARREDERLVVLCVGHQKTKIFILKFSLTFLETIVGPDLCHKLGGRGEIALEHLIW